jgi:UDP-glucose 4-epimerase
VRVLVTGGGGFLGAYVVRDLLAAGHRVTVVDVRESALLTEIVGHGPPPSADGPPPVIRLDINDVGAMLRLCRQAGVEAIVHLAGLLTPECQASPLQGLMSNVAGTAAVFEVADALGVDRLVWAGSISVFGHNSEGPAEGRRYDPGSFYALYKTVNEMQAERYAADFGVPSIGLRIATGYGYGRTGGRSGWVRELIANPALGLPAVVLGGDTQVPWCYIEDVSSALVHALGVSPSGCRIYNLIGDLRWKHEAADFIRSVIPGADIVIEGSGVGYAGGLDDSGIRTGLGWSPGYTMEQGVLATMNRYRARAGLEPLPAPALSSAGAQAAEGGTAQ